MSERFFTDRVVFSVKGIEQEGLLTDPDPLEAEVKRAMIGRARTVQLVADARKFGERGLNVIVTADRPAVPPRRWVLARLCCVSGLGARDAQKR